MAVKPIPEGYHSVIPYLVVSNAEQTLAFLKDVFEAKEHDITRHVDGRIWHADLIIGDSHVMLSEASEQTPAMATAIYVYVPDTDATYRRAIAACAASLMEPADQFYGDRNAGVKDAAGNTWWIGTHVEDVPPEEMQRRIAAETQKRARGAGA